MHVSCVDRAIVLMDARNGYDTVRICDLCGGQAPSSIDGK